jgi:diguanylate cyclase (GGDEF)-like protein
VDVKECELYKQNGNYVMNYDIPEGDLTGKCIAFRSSHFEVEVYIGEELVYTVKATNSKLSKSTGYRYNFIDLSQGNQGETVTVKLMSDYKGMTPYDTIYFGNRYAIQREIVSANIFRFSLIILTLVLGFILLLYDFFIVGKSSESSTLFFFAVFTIVMSGWSLVETPICCLITQSPVALMVVDHFALMFMPYAFVMYLRTLFSTKDNIVWDIFVGVCGVSFATRTLLQVFGIKDFKETLFMSQWTLVAGVVLCIVFTVIELVHARRVKLSREFKINLFCIIIFMLSSLADLTGFMFAGRSNVYGMLGFAVYVIVSAGYMIRQSQKYMAKAKEAEVYQHLAYTDELTGIYNRMAFQNDLNSRRNFREDSDKMVVKPTTLFMFDLNDLKICNDSYGHDNGDSYIKMVANAIKEVYGVEGRCYRIGGDEFCVIMSAMSEGDINQSISVFDRIVNALNKRGFVVEVSVAKGYATYDEKTDNNLNDTLKRADDMMYEDKQNIKRARLA